MDYQGFQDRMQCGDEYDNGDGPCGKEGSWGSKGPRSVCR